MASDLYPSLPFRLGDDYYIFEDRHPAIGFISHPNPIIRDNARFLLDINRKYRREEWAWWRLSIPAPSMRVTRFRLSVTDRGGGWMLVLWIVARLLRGH